MHSFQMPSSMRNDRISVALIGLGGNGGQMLTGLAKLHQAMIALGHPAGLYVTAFDNDFVSESNVGRQLYYATDVGQNKADVLVQRVNRCYGLDFESRPERLTERSLGGNYDLIIGCVDSAASRRLIHQSYNWSLWLDLGNSNSSGQVVLGQHWRKQSEMRLPTVVDLFPELLDSSLPEDDAPSCSLADALHKQELFINQGVSTFALNMLWTLFTHGALDYSAVFVNLKHAVASPLQIDPKMWKKRFGYSCKRLKAKAKA